MTSKERIHATFQHKEPDRIPMGEIHIMPFTASDLLDRDAITGEGGMYMKRAVLISQGRRDEFVERYVCDSVDLIRMIGHDLIMSELNPAEDPNYEITEISERGWTEVDKETGLTRQFAYEADKDIVVEIDSTEKQEFVKGILKRIDALENGKYRIDETCFDTTKRICQKIGKEIFCMAKIPDLIPSSRSWYTEFMETAMTKPELTRRICDAYTQFGLEAARGYISCGVDGVMIASDWAMNTGPIFPPSFIEEFMVPQVNAIAEYCHEHDVLVMKHTDGNIMKIAEMFFGMDIDAYQGIEPFAGMNLSEIKEKYGHKVTLMGNVDCGRTLPFGTKNEIIEETKSCIKAAASGGGYILSSSNTISYPISGSALMTMIETGHKFGQYPIDF